MRTREMMNASFINRIKEDQQRSERGSGGGYFKANLPQGVKFWKNTNGPHQIDIVPYFAKSNDPLVVLGKMQEGDEQYVLEFFVHDKVGIGDGNIMCLLRTYGQPCPICEDLSVRTRRGDDEKILYKLKAKKHPRSVYNIIDVDNENLGVQVWHVSHYLMQMHLLELAKIPVRPGQEGIVPVIDFPSPTEGKTIAFKTETKKTKEGDDMTIIVAHRFVDRPSGFKISKSDLDDAWTLDDFLYVPTYKEVCEYYYGPDGKEERSSRNRTFPEEQSDKNPRSRRDSSDEEHYRKENPCPSGHKFGVDVDKFPNDCEDCAEWRVCARANKQSKDSEDLSKQELPREEPPPEREQSSRRSRREGIEEDTSRARRIEENNGDSQEENRPPRRSRRG